MCVLKILTDLCSIKQNTRVKNTFVRIVYSALVVKRFLSEHKEDCLVINGKQSFKLESGFISFKNYSKQIPVSFKIYADFKCILKKVDGDIECNSNSSYTRKYQNHVPCSFAYKVVCVDNKFSKKIVLYQGKDAVYEFIKLILKGSIHYILKNAFYFTLKALFISEIMKF